MKAALTVLVTALSLLIAACGPTEQRVCAGEPAHVVVVPSTSMSEYETSRELTPAVVEQAIERVVASCGRLTLGIMTSNPERDLELRSIRLVPREAQAFKPEPIRRELVERATQFAEEHLLRPLEHTRATRGSPFFTTYAKIGRELTRHRWGTGTVISIGDGLVVDRSPDGEALMRLDRRAVPPEAVLDRFVPMLESLGRSCVMLVGQGATDEAGPSPERLRTAERLLGRTLNRAGVRFVATRSRELPPGCHGGPQDTQRQRSDRQTGPATAAR